MSFQALQDPGVFREDAAAAAGRGAHAATVERVVATMRDRLGEALTLQDMADVAHLSPFYFARVFRDVTGIPPAEYLAALRLQEAKRLLLTTPASVTDVCFAVGYSGLGTFTTRFARLVGLPPGRLRQRAADVDGIVASAQPFGGAPASVAAVKGGVNGSVQAPGAAPGLIFVGLFPTPIPQATPVGSALLDRPGRYHIPRVPDGRYYALAAAFPPTTPGLAYLVPDDAVRVGAARAAVTVRDGRAAESADIVVGPPRPTGPPLLVALPFLLVDQHGPA